MGIGTARDAPSGSNPAYLGGLWPLTDAPSLKPIPTAATERELPTALWTPHYCDSENLRESATIHCLRFNQKGIGIAVGDHGLMLRSIDNGATWDSIVSEIECSLSDVFWVDANRLVAVGGGADPITGVSRGVVLTSRDGGQTWTQSLVEDLPRFWSLQFESEYQDRGAPNPADRTASIIALGDVDPVTGNHVFVSHDAGKTWQGIEANESKEVAQPGRFDHITMERCRRWRELIGQPCLIRMSCKIDAQTFLCAGDHGNLYRSTDGGKTWNSVRQTGQCGLLVIAKDASSIPWSMIGRQTLEERLRCNILVATSDRGIPPSLRQSAMNLGVASVECLDAATDLHNDEVSRILEIFDAPVIAIDSRLSQTTRKQIRLQAAQGRTSKVIEFSSDGAGEMLLHRNALLSDSGTIANDFEIDSQLWSGNCSIESDDQRLGQGIYINTVYSTSSQQIRSDDLSSGVQIDSQCRLPKRESTASRHRQQVVQGRLRQQERLTSLLAQTQRSPAWFADSFNRLLDQTSRHDRFRLAWSLAAQARRHPHLSTVLKVIENRFPQTSAGQLAGTYARTRESSVEWNYWRGISSVKPSMPQAIDAPIPQDSEILPSGSGHANIVSPFQSMPTDEPAARSAVIQTSALVPVDETTLPRTGSQELDLAWEVHPVKRIAEASIKRSLDQADESVHANADAQAAALRQIANQENGWASLLRQHSDQVTVARRTMVPPKLDGKLDDNLWQTAWKESAATAEDAPVRIAMAWDNEFLYVAVVVPSHRFRQSQIPNQNNYRDADLKDVDRLKLCFDADRDLFTSMNLTCCRDRRTRDDLDGVTAWNPTWYFATDQQDNIVVCEMAIQLSSLSGMIESGDSWFVQTSTIASGEEERFQWMPDSESRIRVDFQ
ncbi:hypothetical protein ACMFWY_26005 [Roseiconus sp. JC912]